MTITDDQRLSQIISNLLENAFKFTWLGEVEFGYVLKGSMLQFYVKDSGIGVEHKDQELIFRRFEQAKRDNSKIYDGTGLGLSIVKSFVELLGGEIWVESELNKGATFYFTIPYQPAKLAKEVEVTNVTDNEAHEIDLPNRVILVVEDNYLNNLFLKQVLTQTQHNCVVLCAYNGKEAMDLLRTNAKIDIILLDINMPILDGYETIKQVRELGAPMKVIAQTGYGMEDDLKKIKEAGFDDYLIKPISEKELINVLKRQLLRHSEGA